MEGNFKNQKEALAMAIDMEKEGRSFYLKTAEKATDKMTKDVFTFLASEELKHIDAIKVFYDGEIAGKPTDFDKMLRFPVSIFAPAQSGVKLFPGALTREFHIAFPHTGYPCGGGEDSPV